MKMRHEVKHLINQADHRILAHRLGVLFLADHHADAHGAYRVRSLYFDNWKDKALLEKINGVNRREKFRIRLYNGDDAFIRLEKKIKVNGLCAKKSTLLNREQVEGMLAGDIAWMPFAGQELLTELYSKMQGQLLRPKAVIDYLRHAYTFPAGNVRITLDSDIRTGRPEQLFEEDAAMLPVGQAAAVLEVKYDNYIPQLVLDAVRLPGRQAASLSKYALGRRLG